MYHVTGAKQRACRSTDTTTIPSDSKAETSTQVSSSLSRPNSINLPHLPSAVSPTAAAEPMMPIPGPAMGGEVMSRSCPRASSCVHHLTCTTHGEVDDVSEAAVVSEAHAQTGSLPSTACFTRCAAAGADEVVECGIVGCLDHCASRAVVGGVGNAVIHEELLPENAPQGTPAEEVPARTTARPCPSRSCCQSSRYRRNRCRSS